MTVRRTRLEVELGARDNASATVDDLADKIDRLSDEDKVIALRGQADQLEREVRRAERALGRIDKYDGEQIDLIVDARDQASRKLDAVQAQLRDLDGETATVDVEVDAFDVDALNDKLAALGGRAGDIGRQITGALTNPYAAAGALAGALVIAGDRAADTAIQAGTIAQMTGDSVENASRLAEVWSRVGDTNDLLDVLAQSTQALGDNVELAERLGVNLSDGATLGERFVDLVSRVQTELDGAAERSQVMSQLFGEEGARQVTQLITLYGDLGDAIDRVPDTTIVSDADVENAREFKQEFGELTANLEGFANTAGQVVLPVLGEVARVLNEGTAYAAELGTSLGRGLRQMFDGGAAHRAREAADSVAEAEAAARSFDRALLEQAETAEDVRRIVQAYGLDLHAQNLLVVEWAEDHRDAADDIGAHAGALDRLRGAADNALDVFVDPGWQRYLDQLNDINAQLAGAPGLFDDLVAAAERGLAMGSDRRQTGDGAPPVSFRVSGGASPFLTGPTPSSVHVGDVIIHNPPGTPAATADLQRTYDKRNGYR